MYEASIVTMKDAQKAVRYFAKRNRWQDIPNIDKFDHIHEELVEISQLLRYQTEEERLKTIAEKHDKINEEFGDLIFGIYRLANQLGIDVEEAFNLAKEKVFSKYDKKGPEHKIIRDS